MTDALRRETPSPRPRRPRGPGHSFKYAARLQEVHGDGPNPVMLCVQKSTGHGGGMPVSMRVELEAERWAFVLHHLGVE